MPASCVLYVPEAQPRQLAPRRHALYLRATQNPNPDTKPNTNTNLAPQADTDDCIRVAVRFAVGATVECLVGRDKDSGKDQWVRGKVGSRLGAPRRTTITTLTLTLSLT